MKPQSYYTMNQDLKAIKCQCCGIYLIMSKNVKHKKFSCPACIKANCKNGKFIKIHKKEIEDILRKK